MIYWGEDSELSSCKFCQHPRFKTSRRGSHKQKTNVPFKKMYYFPLTPRLQRLYASAVCKIKARAVVEVAKTSTILISNARAFQEDVTQNHHIDIETDQEP